MSRVFYFFLNVETIVGLPPGFPAFRFLVTADRFCDLVIAAAERTGLHFGYFLEPVGPRSFLPADAPHGGCLPVFGSLREISTHFCFNHLPRLPLGTY